VPVTATGASQVTILERDRSRAAVMESWLEAAGVRARVANEDAESLARSGRPSTGHCYVVHASLWTGMPWSTVTDDEFGDGRSVIVLMEEASAAAVVRVLRAGVADVVLLPTSAEELVGVVQRALARDRERQARRLAHQEASRRLENLSKRERQVLGFVLEGYSNKRMSEALGVSIKTIEAHRANLMRKCDCRSVASLVKLALLAGEGHPNQVPPPGL
jgi:FixJ family two-component response regulator